MGKGSQRDVTVVKMTQNLQRDYRWTCLFLLAICYRTPLFKKIVFLKYLLFLFVWLCPVLVAARGVFNLYCSSPYLLVAACGIYFLNQESNPGPLHWERRVLDHQGSPQNTAFKGSPDISIFRIYMCAFT